MKQQKNFLLGIVDQLAGIRVGVVKISCPAETFLTIGSYTSAQLKSHFDGMTYSESMTGTKEAFDMAFKALDKESSQGKAVFVMSDGEDSNCHFPNSIKSEFDTADDALELQAPLQDHLRFEPIKSSTSCDLPNRCDPNYWIGPSVAAFPLPQNFE
ncbi:hypothetical protein COOONC_24028 [Cooperia oncophora]